MNKDRYSWLNSDAKLFLKRGYLSQGEEPLDRFNQIAQKAEEILGIEGYADKFLDYFSRGWFSLASPTLSNFGKNRGLSISCNGSHVSDEMISILYKNAELGMMTKFGAGTSVYLGSLRPRGAEVGGGGTSPGPVHFASLFDATVNIVSQSNIRRGNCAVYLDVEHPDILEFLAIREEGHPIQHLSIGVCLGDEWLAEMEAGDRGKRKIWAKIIQKRYESGYPYLFFRDTVNNNAPEVYKSKGLRINSSNLCTEIMLPATEEESFVCDLASMNLLFYDEWKDTDAVETVIYLLDAQMTEYIERTKGIKFMSAPHNFAKNHRALGLGALGWHSYLQSKMLPFDCMESIVLNNSIWKNIREQAEEASRSLAAKFGECPITLGTGRRNSTLLSIAPTTSSSFILGQVSPSIEPLNSNYFIKDLAKGKFTFKNPYLKKILFDKGKDTDDIWRSILLKGGSVQHLDCLSEKEKEVFLTFGEISQKAIVIQAASRQKYIDQGQSLNLMIHPSVPAKKVSDLLLFGWKQGIKSFYYQRGTNLAQELGRDIMSCSVCEG